MQNGKQTLKKCVSIQLTYAMLIGFVVVSLFSATCATMSHHGMGGLFASANSCQEHAFGGVGVAIEELFGPVVLTESMTVLFGIISMFVVGALRVVPVLSTALRLKERSRRLQWIWSRKRPFSSFENFIPFFVPTTDA